MKCKTCGATMVPLWRWNDLICPRADSHQPPLEPVPALTRWWVQYFIPGVSMGCTEDIPSGACYNAVPDIPGVNYGQSWICVELVAGAQPKRRAFGPTYVFDLAGPVTVRYVG